MPGCIQPMSSPMMKRMLGFCGGCFADAGVMAGPDTADNMLPPSSEAQHRLYLFVVLRDVVGMARGLSLGSSIGTPSCLCCVSDCASDASKARLEDFSTGSEWCAAGR